MKILLSAILALTTVLSLSACASGRPCPPGYHLGPHERACHPN